MPIDVRISKLRVRRFSAQGKKKGTFIAGLPDMPEFLVHVPDRAADRGPAAVRR